MNNKNINSLGKITQIIGAVVDVQFPEGKVPAVIKPYACAYGCQVIVFVFSGLDIVFIYTSVVGK